MTAVYVCDCTHPQDAHHGSTYACRTADCRCVRFTPDIARAAVKYATGGIVTGPIRLPSAGCVIEPAEDTLSTSARLRQVEQERDELLSIVARIGDALSPTGERPEEALGTLAADVEAFVALHDVVEDERDRLRTDLARLEEHQEIRARVVRERNAERAELASARQELAQLHAARDWIVARDGEGVRDMPAIVTVDTGGLT